MSHYDTGGIVLPVLTFLNNGSNYKAINSVRIFSDKDLVIILVECHEDAFIFKRSKYLPDICMVTKAALVVNILNFNFEDFYPLHV